MNFVRMCVAVCLAWALVAARADATGEVADSVKSLYARLSAGDAAGFSAYLLPEGFTEFYTDGVELNHLDTRYFAQLMHSGAKIDLRVTDVRVQTIAADVAIATGYREGTITPPGGKPIASRQMLTMVWRKALTGWQLRHVHLSDAAAHS